MFICIFVNDIHVLLKEKKTCVNPYVEEPIVKAKVEEKVEEKTEEKEEKKDEKKEEKKEEKTDFKELEEKRISKLTDEEKKKEEERDEQTYKDSIAVKKPLPPHTNVQDEYDMYGIKAQDAIKSAPPTRESIDFTIKNQSSL